MTQLFDRRCVVLVGKPPPDNYVLIIPDALKIDGMRTTFKVTKDDKPEPNQVEISIFNLSAASRAKCDEKGVRVVLQAGYGDDVAQIASADVRTVNHLKQGVDWVTKIEAGDGERAIEHARVSGSFRPGTAVKDIVGKTIQALQMDPGNAQQKAQQLAGEFSSGYVQHAKASTELSRLLEPAGWSWSVQDGRIELLGPGEVLGELAPLFSPSTGLVGVPEMGSPGAKGEHPVLKCRSLLQPRLRPGQRFKLESASRSGTFVAKKVTHSGDTFGNDWYTDVEAVAE